MSEQDKVRQACEWAVIEHLGLPALTGGKISVYDAAHLFFKLGADWQASIAPVGVAKLNAVFKGGALDRPLSFGAWSADGKLICFFEHDQVMAQMHAIAPVGQEAVVTVKVWSECLGIKPRQVYELKWTDAGNKLPDGEYKFYTAPQADMGVVEIDYELYCNGEDVASANSLEEIQRYAFQYSEDGPIEIYEVTRAPVKRTLLANKGEK